MVDLPWEKNEGVKAHKMNVREGGWVVFVGGDPTTGWVSNIKKKLLEWGCSIILNDL